jgi:hypothetical protein
VKRLKYGSPSNRGREIENDAGLVKYKQRLSLAGIGLSDELVIACRNLATLAVGSPEFNSTADSIVVKADELTRSSLAADRGTHGHALTEALDRKNVDALMRLYGSADEIGLDYDTCLNTVTAWVELLAVNELEILAIEASCVDDRWRLAGTLDRIVRLGRDLSFAKPGGEIVTIAAGTVVVLDVKFGKTRKAHNNPIEATRRRNVRPIQHTTRRPIHANRQRRSDQVRHPGADHDAHRSPCRGEDRHPTGRHRQDVGER